MKSKGYFDLMSQPYGFACELLFSTNSKRKYLWTRYSILNSWNADHFSGDILLKTCTQKNYISSIFILIAFPLFIPITSFVSYRRSKYRWKRRARNQTFKCHSHRVRQIVMVFQIPISIDSLINVLECGLWAHANMDIFRWVQMINDNECSFFFNVFKKWSAL